MKKIIYSSGQFLLIEAPEKPIINDVGLDDFWYEHQYNIALQQAIAKGIFCNYHNSENVLAADGYNEGDLFEIPKGYRVYISNFNIAYLLPVEEKKEPEGVEEVDIYTLYDEYNYTYTSDNLLDFVKWLQEQNLTITRKKS